MREFPTVHEPKRKHLLAFAVLGMAAIALASGMFGFFVKNREPETAFRQATNDIRVLNEKNKALSAEINMLREESALREASIKKSRVESKIAGDALSQNLERSRANESNLRAELESLKKQLEQADAQIAILAKALAAKNFSAQPKKETENAAHRRDELMANHYQITGDFERPRIYAHKIRGEFENTRVTEQGVLSSHFYGSGLRSLKVLAKNDLYEIDYRPGSFELSGYEVAVFLKTIVTEKYPNLTSFRVMAIHDSIDSLFKSKESILEGDQLRALRETFELSEILKAEIARQRRTEEK